MDSQNETELQTAVAADRVAVLRRITEKTRDGSLEWENLGGDVYRTSSTKFVYRLSSEYDEINLDIYPANSDDDSPEPVAQFDWVHDTEPQIVSRTNLSQMVYALHVLVQSIDTTNAEILEDLK